MSCLDRDETAGYRLRNRIRDCREYLPIAPAILVIIENFQPEKTWRQPNGVVHFPTTVRRGRQGAYAKGCRG